MFDHVLLLARGKCLYNGEGGSTASRYFASKGVQCPDGYNIADHLLDIASDPPSTLNEEKAQGSGGSRSLEGKQDESSIGVQKNDVIVHTAILPSVATRQ